MEEYDVKQNRWKRLPDMPRGRSSCAVVLAMVHGRRLMIVAGGGCKEIDVYRLDYGVWEEWPALDEGRIGCCLAIIDTDLYIIGGIKDAPTLDVSPNTSANALNQIESNRALGLSTMRMRISQNRLMMSNSGIGDQAKWEPVEESKGWPSAANCLGIIGE